MTTSYECVALHDTEALSTADERRYLKRVHAAVDDVKRRCGGGPVTLIAHSAGGWLGRVYLLGYGTAGITRLVTLGAPHQPPPSDSKYDTQAL